jgi:hypothetical protein
MRAVPAGPANSRSSSNQWLVLAALLGATLGVLFYQSFEPHQILFANDAPLGFLKSEQNRLPSRFAGCWHNLAWLGNEGPAAAPTISTFVATLLPRELFLKVYAPFTLFFAGFSAWVFFRSLRFNSMVCVLGGVATGLNMHFFSIACWGLGSWNVAAGTTFLALAALSTKSIKQTWAKAILAGLAVGMGLMEGFDVGAILSTYLGVFVVFRALVEEASASRKIVSAAVSEVLVVFFAGLIAANALFSLVQTQIEGVGAMGQDALTKEQRWNPATQWSLPKVETLDLLVPGLFGYRMTQHITDADHSSAYWGRIGQDPRIAVLAGGKDDKAREDLAVTLNARDSDKTDLTSDDPQKRFAAMTDIVKRSGIYWRYSGTGEFAGIMVSLLALFGVANAGRRDTPYSKSERVLAGFWGVAAVFSLLAAWGRYGFVYRFLYQLPYFSTMRNPIKFLHPFHIAWVILAAYGMEAIYRRYLRNPAKTTDVLPQHLQSWWAKVTGFDKRWTFFVLALGVVGVGGFIIFDNSKVSLIEYLESQFIPQTLAFHIAAYSVNQVLWFLLYLLASVFVMICVISGAWTGPRMKWAWICIGTVMILDLARADLPWVRYYDYTEKYSPNSVTDFLEDKPYENRVIGKLEPRGPGSGITAGFGELYFFWLQNDFPYHNIQTLDFAQMSHIPDLDRLFLKAFELKGTDIATTDLSPAVRLWRLTNTRYLLGTANSAEMLNDRVDPKHDSFQVRQLFNIVGKPGIYTPSDFGDFTIEPGEKGTHALIEYTGTLPRAKLFSHWMTPTNDDQALAILSSPDFDPTQTVLVSKDTPLEQASGPIGADAGAVVITDYHPKEIELVADAKTPAILWMAERIGPDWKVLVDKQPARVLRCNYLMRGVYLPPGNHVIEFKFHPSLKPLYVSLLGWVVGIALAGYLVAARAPAASGATPSQTTPAAAPAAAAAAAPPPPAPAPAPPAPGLAQSRAAPRGKSRRRSNKG